MFQILAELGSVREYRPRPVASQEGDEPCRCVFRPRTIFGMAESHPSPVTEAWQALEGAARRLNDAIGPLLTEEGLTVDQYEVLRILGGAGPGGLSRSAVTARFTSRAPDMTRMLDRLERDGRVERRRGRKDARRSMARITPAGLELLTRLGPEIEEALAIATRRLTRIQLRRLTDLCGELDRQE